MSIKSTDEGPGRNEKGAAKGRSKTVVPTSAQRLWLSKGLNQPGGKLPLFDDAGRQVPARTIRACIAAGWAEPWFSNPIKPDWLVCKLTTSGAAALRATGKSKKS
ncbi:hypothetical protein [uncultured Roseibium sp.]|uniref:hypothetical protein n=1 Tax=uncultured Roseibium sp. TaxID=1936171 RepID=UPI0032163005